MPLDTAAIAAAMEQILDVAISAIPGNPAIFVPEEKILLHDLISAGLKLIDGKIAATTAPAQPAPTPSA